ncbi:MAG: GH3 auxin-responsive promoter family protein, partial [Flavobacteriales bacterium]|nr:GH3 auxin-responsive promoter family protein [Flavobacteriales bacterium]
MSLKASLSKPYARWVTKRVMRRALDAVGVQQQVLRKLVGAAAGTSFGKAHRLGEVTDHADLVQAVPLRDYEGFRPYIDRIVAGERDVLWPGQPLYLCKTSGTTSGAKYIPISRESLPNHINSARNALLAYIARSGNASFVDG